MVKFTSRLAHLAAFLFLISLIGSCKKEIQLDNSDARYPLTLQMSVSDETPIFSWSRSISSKFQRYVLLRSTDPIPNGLNPLNLGGQNFKVVANIEQVDSLRFTDNETLLTDSVYYKLYLKFDERFLESENVVVRLNVEMIDGISATKTLTIPDSSWFVVFSANTGKMIVYDLKNRSTIAEQSLPINGFSQATFGLLEGEMVLFIYSGGGTYHAYSLPELKEKQSSPSGNSVFSMVYTSGFLVSTEYDYSRSVVVRRAKDLAILKYAARSEYYTDRRLFLLDESKLRFVEIYSNYAVKFDLNSSTGAISNTSTVSIGGNFSGFCQKIAFSPDGKYFVPFNDGKIFDRTILEVSAALPQSGSVIDFEFSEDSKYLYRMVQVFDIFGNLRVEIRKFSVPDMNEVGMRSFLGVNPVGLSRYEGKVQMVVNNGLFSGLIIKTLNF